MPHVFARSVLALAMLLLAAATGLGAYASHGLTLEPDAMQSLWTGINFQFFHSLGLFGLALVIERAQRARIVACATLAIAAGVVLFCGGVYASSLGGPSWIAQLAPIGGVALILGWMVAAAAVLLTAVRRAPR